MTFAKSRVIFAEQSRSILGVYLHHSRVDALGGVAGGDVDARVDEDDDGHREVERGRCGEDDVRVASVRGRALAALGRVGRIGVLNANMM